MATKKLYRCRWDRKISGVFGGLGQYINIDPTILRLIAIFLIIPSGIILLPILYLIAAWIIPEGPKAYMEPHFKKLTRNSRKKLLGGICAGIGDYFKIDPNIVRLLFVILFFVSFGFPLVIAYIIGVFIIPTR